ncbi:hypothetical protein M5362_03535 [Streptomyces sp. Je 1-79]|uniref:hypothetical protein n=1 Tax=Streptomyces sp. Je 1-79 TaxID=2943847 RepID=UPI0021A8BFEC|nr:hypothetical protein [Streptomyces sp. Je 1-79]MCT4352202.1 hypothetical protein [Streptomyces sp. Je 1-79]
MRERETREAAGARQGRGAVRHPVEDGSATRGLAGLQGRMGNTAVVQLLRRSGHPGARDALMPAPAPSPAMDRTASESHATASPQAAPQTAVQRAVTVGGSAVADLAELIASNGLDDLVTDTGRRVLAYLGDPRVKVDLAVQDADYLVLEVGRIAAMIDLIHSINGSGILGRRTLVGQDIAHTGSNDLGDTTALAVNVLDKRGTEDPDRIRGVVNQSLTQPDNGSFSVAMERPRKEDMILREIDELTEGRLSESERQQIARDAMGDASLVKALENMKKGEKLEEARAEVVARFTSLLQERTQNTAMAIVSAPGQDVANLAPGARTYESDVPSDRLAPGGAGGFTSLVLPQWFESYGPLLMDRDWPQGVTLGFAGNKQITAHYKARGRDWPVTVDAPDYAPEIERQLRQFQVIATHILKAAGGA